MNSEKTEQLKQKLILQKHEIHNLETILSESSQTVTLDQSKVGRLSRMDAMQSQQIALEATRRRQQQLINIETALRRINTDEYGFCLECGEEIDLRRLEFDPSYSHCITCAELKT